MTQSDSMLYVSPLSPFGARLRLVMGFTGQSLSEILPPDGSGSEAMKAISYFGKIPAIDIGSRVLIESLPLMEYLVEKAGGSPLIPANAEERAAMRGIALAHDHYAITAVRPMFVQLRSPNPDRAIAVAALKDGAAQYETLTRMFDKTGDFALGGKITLADLAIAPFGYSLGRLYPAFGETSPFASQPRLASWWNAVRVVPEVAKVLEFMEAAFNKAFPRK